MFQLSGQVIYNQKIKQDYFEIALFAPQIAKTALPGQFVNIKVSDGIEPLLRRPLSIHRIGLRPSVSGLQSKKNQEIIMLYEVVGKGTEILAQRKAGDYLDVIGPLGKGFDYEGRRTKDEGRRVLVAGGMGTAPLVFLAEKLVHSPHCPAVHRKPLVLLGAKTKEDILCEKEFKELDCEVKIATDDGSREFKGYVSDLLSYRLSTIDYRLSTIYACGPGPMLKEISLISQKYNILAQLSLESHLACGIGACMGCVVKTRDERRGTKDAFQYKRVCKEGPVFAANQILWE